MVDGNFSLALKDRVTKWLQDENWSLSDIASGQNAWAFVAAEAHGRRVVLFQPRSRPDKVGIQASVTMAPEQLERMEALSAEERDSFLWDLRIELVKAGYDFDTDKPVTRIRIVEECYFDGLTKDTFMARLRHIKLGIALVQWTVQRRLTGPKA